MNKLQKIIKMLFGIETTEYLLINTKPVRMLRKNEFYVIEIIDEPKQVLKKLAKRLDEMSKDGRNVLCNREISIKIKRKK